MGATKNIKVVINLTPILIAITAVLAVLKLTGVVGWSWWAVTAPIWGPFAVTVAIWLLVMGLILGALLIASIFAAGR